MNYAYAIAWIGELGGVHNVQIASDSPETIERHGPWPIPLLILTTQGKTFQDASDACKKKLRERAPGWERFMRSPARMRPIAPQMRARVLAATKTPKR